jgi:hypothetical protein
MISRVTGRELVCVLADTVFFGVILCVCVPGAAGALDLAVLFCQDPLILRSNLGKLFVFLAAWNAAHCGEEVLCEDPQFAHLILMVLPVWVLLKQTSLLWFCPQKAHVGPLE